MPYKMDADFFEPLLDFLLELPPLPDELLEDEEELDDDLDDDFDVEAFPAFAIDSPAFKT